MANQSSNISSSNSTQNHINKPISSFLTSPRIFNGLLMRNLSDIQINKTSRDWLHDTEITNPNFIFDGMQNLNIGNPFGYDRKSPNPITNKPPTIKTTTKNTIQSQTSEDKDRVYESGVNLNSTLDGMQNHNLRNPFGGYDRKSPNPITKKLSSNKLESKITAPQFQTSQNQLYHAESMVSPKSILDGMQNHTLRNPFGYDLKPPNPITKEPSNNKMESESIGLALIDPRVTSEKSSLLFGAKLKVEIPSIVEVKISTFGDFDEMESSEDYTCVITHGPNPKTTHIFDNCIIESCFGVRKLREKPCKVDDIEDKGI